MARIPDEEIERLKSQVDLVALVQSKGIELKNHGADLAGHCPFHDDKSPSLIVTPSKNLWHCMGACQVGGSVIDWVMKCEGVSFRHAVELLRSGSPLQVFSSKLGPRVASIRKLSSPVSLDADDQAALRQVIEYYHETLKTSPEALSYLAARGIESSEAIEKFKLGFANRTLGIRLPNANRAAGNAIRGKLATLGVYRETGHEHFSGSLVIPIMDQGGNITEIYGRKITRALRAGTPDHTYLPGPHRGIFNPECLQSSEVILCEALIDALTFWVNGFKNVTASYGVGGFTEDHLAAFIKNGVKKVYIAYDRDEAGDSAAVTLHKKLLSEGIESVRVLFPKGMDVNSFAIKVKPAALSLKVALEKAMFIGKMLNPATTPVPEPIAKPAAKKEMIPAPEMPITTVEMTPVIVEAVESPIRKPLDVPTEIKGEDIVIRLGEREYRVRGLNKNLSYEVMRVNLRASVDPGYHIDTLDLYNAKARTAFINAAAEETGAAPEVIKRDLGRVLLKCEELQEIEIKKVLDGEKDKKIEITDFDKKAALELLKSPDLLKRILADFESCGVIGEETNKIAGYLASVSRKLEDPLAVIIQSSSAAGKSSLMEAVLAMMPAEEKVKYSAMTGQSLFYIGEKNLKNKILAIAEEEGAHQAAYALKLLQSEGEISIASTGKDPTSGRLITHEYRVEGPVMIFLTTTAIEIDEELLNRCLVLTVNEDRAQTKAIHELQRSRQTLEGLLSREERKHILNLHQNAQRLLRPLVVANPYAKSLKFMDTRTRMRRDHMKYLTLIRAVALLHQYQRETKTFMHRGKMTEYIEVEPRDIEIANDLCHQILGRSLDELPPQTRRLLSQITGTVNEICVRDKMDRASLHFTRKQVRDWTGWSDFQVQMHMNKLVALEYLTAHRGARGSQFVYELLFDGDASQSGLHLIGLSDLEKSHAQSHAYDGKFEPLTQSFEHKKGEFKPPSSIPLASVLMGSGTPETPAQKEIRAESENEGLKTRIRALGNSETLSYMNAGEGLPS